MPVDKTSNLNLMAGRADRTARQARWALKENTNGLRIFGL